MTDSRKGNSEISSFSNLEDPLCIEVKVKRIRILDIETHDVSYFKQFVYRKKHKTVRKYFC